MVDSLITFDAQEIVEKSKEVLRQKGQLPVDCPLKKCLSLRSIKLDGQEAIITLDAQPPQLATDKKWKKYETNPICREKCGISGNANINFQIRQNTTSGDILSVDADWKSSFSRI